MLNFLKKKSTQLMLTVIAIISFATNAFAVAGPSGMDPADVTTKIANITTDITVIILAVATSAFTLYAIFLGFRYGKKIFQRLANG